MDSYRLQLILFDMVKERSKNPKLWIDELSKTLNLSKSAIYKKVNATSSLSIEELSILLLSYNISFDQLINPDVPNIPFTFPYMSREVKSFIEYLTPIDANLEMLGHLPNATVQYATYELPIFYWLLNRNIAYFKLFVFAQTIWELEEYKDKKFTLDEFSGEPLVLKECAKISKKYFNLPSIEYWNEHLLSNTLNQIKYLANGGQFEDLNDALQLCDDLTELILHLKEMAREGKKFLPGSQPSEAHTDFSLYHNEINHTSNTILVNSDSASSIFTVFDNPNFMVSQDANLISYSERWFTKLRQYSLPVSKDARKSRMHLFSQILRRIEATKVEIEMIRNTGTLYGDL